MKRCLSSEPQNPGRRIRAESGEQNPKNPGTPYSEESGDKESGDTKNPGTPYSFPRLRPWTFQESAARRRHDRRTASPSRPASAPQFRPRRPRRARGQLVAVIITQRLPDRAVGDPNACSERGGFAQGPATSPRPPTIPNRQSPSSNAQSQPPILRLRPPRPSRVARISSRGRAPAAKECPCAPSLSVCLVAPARRGLPARHRESPAETVAGLPCRLVAFLIPHSQFTDSPVL
jgi:hypothetical protein